MRHPPIAPTLRRLLGVAVASAALLLAGCATTTEGGVPINTEHTAKGQDSRVLFLILHYTVADFPTSMKILTQQEVSAHYLLSDESPPVIYRLVDENRRAWHSGASAWADNARLNSSSIGIEIVHPGFKPGTEASREYLPFPKAQIDALIPLVKDIVARHQIKPERILGHGEVSAQYKEDPGPTFPWKRLAELGITPPWPDALRVAAQRALYEGAVPDAAWFQKALASHGYAIQPSGVWDAQSRRVLMNFQIRYRPSDYRGEPDAESAAILWVLTTPPQALLASGALKP
ncbi:MAG: N-acetylmuramoyl-L-alanine amidase [Rubrivivax sp.]